MRATANDVCCNRSFVWVAGVLLHFVVCDGSDDNGNGENEIDVADELGGTLILN